MIALFTDFGLHGPYTGQMKAVLHHMAPGVPVIDLFADAPTGNPTAAAYLLVALRMALGLRPGLPAMRAHGVRELAAYLRGEASLDEAIAKAKTETRRYAKRQMTWARRFMQDWDWFPDADAAAAL